MKHMIVLVKQAWHNTVKPLHGGCLRQAAMHLARVWYDQPSVRMEGRPTIKEQEKLLFHVTGLVSKQYHDGLKLEAICKDLSKAAPGHVQE